AARAAGGGGWHAGQFTWLNNGWPDNDLVGATSLLTGGLRTIAAKPGAIGMSAPIFVLVDDKHIPVYRIMWVSDVPHFCGNEECQCEGDYEIRLEQDESIWASRPERDTVLKAVEAWYNGEHQGGGHSEEDEL